MIQSPNSFFMDVKCPGCLQITTVFSHAQTVVLCGNCNVMVLALSNVTLVLRCCCSKCCFDLERLI
ncbi:RPS27A, partial [Symbiodinium necroappetens]